jgi:hypothetical protein
MSKPFVKLIDSALLPAALMICGKVVGLWVANSLFDLDWTLNTDTPHFAALQLDYFSTQDALIATSYSNAIMFLFVAIGFSFLLYQALFLHSSHISPFMLSKLAERNLMHLIKDTFHVYFETGIWAVFIWICVLIIFIHSVIGTMFIWIFFITFAIASVLSVLLLRDVQAEIQLAQSEINIR